MPREATVEIAYVPFKTFQTALDTLRQGIPDPVDRSVFRNQSFSTQAMIVSTLKALGAIDDAGHKQPVLDRLVNPDSRKAALKEVLEDRYRAVLDLGMAATEKQFDDCFAAYGVGGDTRKKAKSFFLQAAAMAGISLSPHIPGARITTAGQSATTNGAPRRRRGEKRKRQEALAPGTLATPRGSSKTIQLATGSGEVTLTVSIDPMELESGDRAFVFDLIDKLKQYEKNSGPVKSRAAESGAAES